jgi:Uma2 family endonuclease
LPAHRPYLFRGIDIARAADFNTDMAIELTRRRFSVDDYHRMAEAGILTRRDRVELIDGDVVEMTPIGGPHARCVMYLNEVFVRRLEGRAIVSPQNSLRLSHWSEPEPDIALLRPPLAKYGKAIAATADALLVVEVADTSQYRDRVVKLPRYAAAGVPETWIVDLEAGVVEVYRDPSSEGYREQRRFERGADVAPAAFPDVVMEVADILG